MQNDTILYDSTYNRPLPKWLTDQREGLNSIQPQKIEIKEDHSLKISLVITLLLILLAAAISTVYILKKYRNKI